MRIQARGVWGYANLLDLETIFRLKMLGLENIFCTTQHHEFHLHIILSDTNHCKPGHAIWPNNALLMNLLDKLSSNVLMRT